MPQYSSGPHQGQDSRSLAGCVTRRRCLLHNSCARIGQHPAICGHSSAGSCSEFDILQVLACVLLADLGKAADGLRCGELAAFCVHPSYRGSGRGDSLLDYVEQSENRPI